jgi:hypothetical protein
MLTLEEILHKLRGMGVEFAPRTFWKYVDMGLLQEGRKLPGRGNVFFFPEDTPERIRQLYTLNKDVGFPLQLLRQTLLFLLVDKPWDKNVVPKSPSGTEFLVWLAGFMANQQLLNKPNLEQKDFEELNERLRGLFKTFGVEPRRNEVGR